MGLEEDNVRAPAISDLRGRLVRRVLALLLVVLPPLAGGRTATSAVAAGTVYYVDCSGGNDSQSGTSPALAWQSLSRANQAALLPGDSLLLKRGCTWTGPLKPWWQGTATAPITIGAYGSGDPPTIQSGTNEVDAVFITGSYLVLESLSARGLPPQRDAGCENTAVGQMSGFRFAGPAAYNTLRASKATGLTEGVKIEQSSHHNRIIHNSFLSNTMMARLTTSPGDDYGAFGANVHGDDNEIAYNEFSGQHACSYDYGADGSAVEIFGGQRNIIHHNRSIDNQSFTELGNSRSSDNSFYYNVVASSLSGSTFLVTRGSSDGLGPVSKTQVFNNTVYLTGSNATAVVCVGGCSADILTLKNNIIWSEYQAAYVDQAFDEGYNLYWRSSGSPIFKYAPMSATSRMLDPQLVSASGGDFHLAATSPARDSGTTVPLLAGATSDFDGAAVPQGSAVDIGAYELVPPAATPLPTSPPSPTSTPIPTATSTPSTTPTLPMLPASPSKTPTLVPASTPTPTPTLVPASTPTPTPAATITPQITAAASPTRTAAPGGTDAPAAPADVVAVGRAGVIRLSWSPSSTAGVSYNIYRGTSSGHEVLYRTGVRSLWFNDREVASGRTYYYRVSAQSAAGESALSNEVSARAR